MAQQTTAKKSPKRATAKKAARRRQNRPAKPRVQPDVQPESGGLLAGLGNLLEIGAAKPEPETSQQQPSVQSAGYSPEALSAESERLLAGVPEHIGDTSDEISVASAEADGGEAIAALMQSVAFEEQDVQDTIAEMFDWLAERFKSEHWQLSDRQARLLGRPAAVLMNSMWKRLSEHVPDILTKWCEETPGAMAFLLACGMVVGPKIVKQVEITRSRATTRPQPKTGPVQMPERAARDIPPPPGGTIWEQRGKGDTA